MSAGGHFCLTGQTIPGPGLLIRLCWPQPSNNRFSINNILNKWRQATDLIPGYHSFAVYEGHSSSCKSIIINLSLRKLGNNCLAFCCDGLVKEFLEF